MPSIGTGTSSAAAVTAANAANYAANNNRTLTTDSAIFSDQRAPSSYGGDDDDDDTSTDSTGNHRHLEATPARALSAHEHRRLDRAQQQRPFSTATLDGINISHAVHWLANKQIRSPVSAAAANAPAASSRLEPLPLPLPKDTQNREPPAASSQIVHHKHSTLLQKPTSPLLRAAAKVPASAPPGAPSAAILPLSSAIHSLRPSAPSPPPPAQHQQLLPAQQPIASATAPPPLPVPEPMPTVALASTQNMSFARLPDISGLTSAMGTPARPMHAYHHIPIDPAYPAPRKRASRPLAQVAAPVQAQAKHHHHPLNLRARVSSDDDSDDDSGSGESESVMHFPLTSTKQSAPGTPKGQQKHKASTSAAPTQSRAAGPSAHASVSVASDSHPRIFLKGLDHPKNQIAQAAEEAARKFGVEWEGAKPPSSAYAVEQQELQHQQLAAQRAEEAKSPTPPNISPGESTAKLDHMHNELAKIVDRLGRLEAENVPSQPRGGGGGRQRRGGRGIFETDSSGTEAGPALSRGAIKDMQAHMRELMREMQRQRRALGSLVEMEQDGVLEEVEAGEKIRRTLGLPPAEKQVGEGRRGRSSKDALDAEKVPSDREEEPRRLPSPSKAVRQKRLRTERADPEPQAQPAAVLPTWSGDPNALRSHMGDVMRHVHLLRDEVERGLPGSVDRQTASSPVLAERHGDVFDHRPASPFLRPARETRSSPPPAQQHRLSNDEEEDEEEMDVSRVAQERAAEAFAKVRQYSQIGRGPAPAPSPPSNRGPDLYPEHRSVSTQTRSGAGVTGNRNARVKTSERGNQQNAGLRTNSTHEQLEYEHNERDCSVCQAPIKAAERREARRDRVRREDRERRRGSGQETNTDTEEEEVLIDLLVEEAERHRKSLARNGRGRGAEDDPVASWRDLIVLSPAQQESLNRMVKQHMDEFVHQRMLYAELADELKGVHPGMNAMRRRILGEHVMEAVELLEMKAERINVLQRLLGQDSVRDEEDEEVLAEAEERRRRAARAPKGGPRQQRSSKPKAASKLRHEVEAELASDYSDAEDPEEAQIHLSAAAAAARSGHRLRQRSTSPVQHDYRQAQTQAQRPARPQSALSSRSSPPQNKPVSRPTSRSRPRGMQTDYSPPTTLAARDLAVDLERDEDEEDEDETEVGTDEGLNLDLDFGAPQKGEARAGSRQRYAFGMGTDQGRPLRTARTAGSGSSVGQAFGGGRRSRP
ncbi:hypothetical protein A4X13_0g3501 [Tilletia indica]|uniref:Cep57 centrosome microtubule-binding domain-containing protein n=1 Tax=Tilletia indica TaxID=43049 RepID=A0A177TBD2_9BASI|nr:hypothetical protein A4X13_0g3501 [Tilletia indica]